MEILISVKSESQPGPEFDIDCPKCGATQVPAASFTQRDRMSLFYLIPILTQTNAFLRCTSCNKKLLSKVSIEELSEQPERVSEYLSSEVSFVVKFLAIASIVMSIFPVVNFAMVLLAFLLTMKSGGWPKTASKIGFVLSCLVTLFFGFMILAGY